jgi:hypothetical protein
MPLAPSCPRFTPAGRDDGNEEHDLLHVRVPLRHPRARENGEVLHRGELSTDQQGRDLRQGQLRDEAVFAGAAHEPLLRKPGGGARRREFVEVSWDEAFRILKSDSAASARPTRSIRALHRPRPDAGADGSFARQFGTPTTRRRRFCSVNMAAG